MTRKKPRIDSPPTPPIAPIDPDDLLTCPNCGKQDDLRGFDCIGACGGNVFCTNCHAEFSPETGVIHRCNFHCFQSQIP